MSMLHVLFGVLGGAAGGTAPALTDQVSSHADPGNTVYAGFAFDTDGTLYDVGPTALDRTLLDSGQWWPDRPEAGIGSSYQVRCASVGPGQSWSSEPDSIGVWLDIDPERVWLVSVSGLDSPIDKTTTGVFEIRLLGGDGTILATASLSATASN